MSSKVQVMNMAGAAIGSTTRITDPNDNRTLARNINAVWDLSRRAAIREGAWNFAVRRASPGALAAPPKHGYEYKYELPAECLRLLEIHDLVAYRDYQVEGREILCNVSGPLNIRFLADIAEPAEWDEAFAHAFALRIAWNIGTRIAGSSFDKQKVWQDYRDALGAAQTVDALESPHQIQEREESSWLEARHASSSWWPQA
ncbi:hypothetical protein [Aurantiacibacter zhengii]|uniref:Uncharacterized protein n=1 Tax=Aurantiacibacter zhengii TaxID=2307003 RepID=A0A418NU16_9SPHN|nr:hypothetical protein [Aurantiacibacter zhengii]RIV87501.1 hypothetical protein D2V07_03885 [Aurantiacibacter zhengii]